MPARQNHAIPHPQPLRILEDLEYQTQMILLGWGEGFTAARLDQAGGATAGESPSLPYPPNYSETDRLACFVLYLWNVDRGAQFCITTHGAFGPEVPESLTYPYLTEQEWAQGKPVDFLRGWMAGRASFWDQAGNHQAEASRITASPPVALVAVREDDQQAFEFGKRLALQDYAAQDWSPLPRRNS